MSFDPLTSILDIGGKLIDKLIPDPTAKANAQLELLKLQQNGELAQLASETDLAKGQMAINQVEAASNTLFVAGWRPFIGWTCGSALAYKSILYPFMQFVAVLCHYVGPPFPVVDDTSTMACLMGLLGLGGMRTYEKVKGINNRS